MKQKICPFARHTLACGFLFPLAVCASYVWGLLSGRIETALRWDMIRLVRDAAETYLSCAAALGTACLAQYLARSR